MQTHRGLISTRISHSNRISGFHNGSMGLTSVPSLPFTLQRKHLSYVDRIQRTLYNMMTSQPCKIIIPNFKLENQGSGEGKWHGIYHTAKERVRRAVGLPTSSVTEPSGIISHCRHPDPRTTAIHQLSLKYRFLTQ